MAFKCDDGSSTSAEPICTVWTKLVGWPIIERSMRSLWWWRRRDGLCCGWKQQENHCSHMSPVLAIFWLCSRNLLVALASVVMSFEGTKAWIECLQQEERFKISFRIYFSSDRLQKLFMQFYNLSILLTHKQRRKTLILLHKCNQTPSPIIYVWRIPNKFDVRPLSYLFINILHLAFGFTCISWSPEEAIATKEMQNGSCGYKLHIGFVSLKLVFFFFQHTTNNDKWN